MRSGKIRSDNPFFRPATTEVFYPGLGWRESKIHYDPNTGQGHLSHFDHNTGRFDDNTIDRSRPSE